MRGWDPGPGPSSAGGSRARPAPRGWRWWVAVVGLLVRDEGAGRAGQVLADGAQVRPVRVPLQRGRQVLPAPIHLQQLLVAGCGSPRNRGGFLMPRLG